jgi:hypothetical protein
MLKFNYLKMKVFSPNAHSSRHFSIFVVVNGLKKGKVKPSRYTPWWRLGGEEI